MQIEFWCPRWPCAQWQGTRKWGFETLADYKEHLRLLHFTTISDVETAPWVRMEKT